MKTIEEGLRELFRRREPPEGFTERVLARLEHSSRAQSVVPPDAARFWRRPMLRWAAAAIACLLGLLGFARYQHQQRARAQAEEAGRQAILALEITRTEVQAAFEQAQRVTVRALAAPHVKAKAGKE